MKRYFSLILAIAATVSAQIVPSTGNVRGPTSATDNAVARYDGTTGKLIQNSGVTIDDSGNATAAGAIISTGSTTEAAANRSVLDYVAGSTTRLISYGPNASTPGAFQLVGLSSDASAGDIRFSISSSGNATFAGNVTVGNSSVDSGYSLRFTKAVSGTFPRTDKIVFGSPELTNGSAAILGVQTAATGATGYLEFHTTDSGTSAERMRLTASGRLRVGQSTDANDARIYAYYPYSASGGNAAIGTEVDQTTALRAIQFANPNGIVGTIATSGSATSFNTSSDRRLKTNIAPAGSASALIDSIQIVEHDWKAGGHVRFGVIAQDVQTVAPEVVFVGDEGEEVKSPWGVDYSKLVPALIKEVQTLRARVASLEAARN